jgi:hypothetical protein
MGRRDRERIARILLGKEKPIADKVREKMNRVAVSTLQNYSTSNQVKFLADSLHSGKLAPSKLRKSLEVNAHKEMSKGADKIIKSGKKLTMEFLLDEYYKDTEFRKLATEVGLDEAWFVALAETELIKRENG